MALNDALIYIKASSLILFGYNFDFIQQEEEWMLHLPLEDCVILKLDVKGFYLWKLLKQWYKILYFMECISRCDEYFSMVWNHFEFNLMYLVLNAC